MDKKHRNRFLAFGITAGVLAGVLITANVLANGYYFSIIGSVLGNPRAQYADGVSAIFPGSYMSKEEVLKAANELNEEVCEEGTILLKNDNNALPIATPVSDSSIQEKPKISIFGKNSVNLSYGGSGSGGAMGGTPATLYDSLEAAGYDVNPTLRDFYLDDNASGPDRSRNNSNLDDGETQILTIGETAKSLYTDEVKSSYAKYNDAAIVVFTRIGGEGGDLPRMMKTSYGPDAAPVDGARNKDDHYLQLDQNETDLLDQVCHAGFKKVIVLVNSAAPLEMGFLTDSNHYAYQPNIDACLWMGFPGNSGVNAIGRILNGQVNPSGKTVDTFASDFTANPAWFNFGDNRTSGGDQYTQNGKGVLYYFVDYEEDIYVGYRYYETRGAQDADWYKNNVIYPFGYGLSYTTFEWSLEGQNIPSTNLDGNGDYKITVNVKNTGDVAGKEVVQLYGHAPYTPGGIEKPEEVLLDFAKTDLIEPGETKSVTLNFNPYYLASYDYQDKNEDGVKGYQLDAGDYVLSINSDAHTQKYNIDFALNDTISYEADPVTDTPVVNRFSDQENEFFNSDIGLETKLSRSDWKATWPNEPTDEERILSPELQAALDDVTTNNPNDYSGEEMPWYDEPVEITFRDMITDEEGNYVPVDYNDPRWEQLLDECSLDDLINMYDNGVFGSAAIEKIGKPTTNDTDGPAGFTNFMDKAGTYWGTCYYASECVMAATYNTDLIYRLGQMVGEEGIIGANGKGNGLPYSGWYAPGINLHRTPFGGRNCEYFSEDPVLSGKMAAAEIKGCADKGVYCIPKHFALNDQETHRSISGLVTWVSEQAIRELYLRPFEIAVKEGNAKGMMSSFNRIGTRWTGGDYRLLTEILREEWGFKGFVICDFNTIPQYMDSRQMAYAGGDINLTGTPVSWCDISDVSDIIVLRKCAKNVLYVVANSNAMNGDIIGYLPPLWQIGLFIIDGVVAAGIIAWGITITILFLKDERKKGSGKKVS